MTQSLWTWHQLYLGLSTTVHKTDLYIQILAPEYSDLVDFVKDKMCIPLRSEALFLMQTWIAAGFASCFKQMLDLHT